MVEPAVENEASTSNRKKKKMIYIKKMLEKNEIFFFSF